MVASLAAVRGSLGHNILYVAIGFVWLSFRDDGAAEEEVTIRQGHGGYGYQVAALVCLVVFADNVLRRMQGHRRRCCCE